MKIKIKYMLYGMLLLFTLLPICVFGAIMIRENDRRVERVLRDDLTAISGAQIMEINDFCVSRKQEMLRIAEYSMLKDALLASLGKRERQSEEQIQYMKDMMYATIEHTTCLQSMSILNSEFKAVAVSDQDAIADEGGLKAANVNYRDGGFALGNIYERHTEDGTQRMIAAVESVEYEGEIIGYIIEEIPATYFDHIRSETGLWEDGTLYLLDGNGKLITAGTPKEDESRTQYATSEKERENFTKAWNAVDHETTHSGMISYKMGKDTYLTYFSDFADTEWGIRLSVNLSVYKAGVNSYAQLVMVVVACVALVLIIASYFLSKRLTRPINRIADVLDRVQKEQNYSLRVKEMGKDEMGFLAEKTNALLDYVEQERYEIQQAERDPLTGLKNQKAIEKEIQEKISRAAQSGSRIAVGYVDVDDFREINNQFGHLEGDHCIRFVASVLEETIPGAVGRSSGDDFTFCIENVESTESVRKLVSLVLEKLNEGYFSHMANMQMPLPCSIGVAVDSGRQLSFSSLMHQAAEAKYQAKEKGKNTYHIICREEMGGNMFGSNERVLALLHTLRQSVANDCAGFYLVYQPLIHAAKKRVVGAEALLRWNWEPFGEVSPGIFIPLIEDDSCFFKLGNWILRQALIEMREMLTYDPNFMIHVNVSYSQLVRREFQGAVMEVLHETGFPARNLCLELTERCRALDMEYLREVMNYFHAQGISIALDDFGTGFSSLSLLRQLPVDNIKIDQSFVANVRGNAADQAIVRSVVQCAESIDVKVCAEGVETDQIRNYLLQYPKLLHQGFYYSRPVRLEQFREYYSAGSIA